MQNPDRRIVFTIPYKKTFTLIGTTDSAYDGDPNAVTIKETEINYLCKSVNRYLSNQISNEDVVWSYSGIRPLFDDREKNLSNVSREYHLDLNKEKKQAPILSVFGGKITTYRVLAEDAMKRLKPYFANMKQPWTKTEKLPGGDCDGLEFPKFITLLEKKYPWMPIHILHRYAKLYGNLCHSFLFDCKSLDDLGHHFGAGLYEKELLHQIQNEWAKKADDILWRRTKLGLYMTPDQIGALKAYLKQE